MTNQIRYFLSVFVVAATASFLTESYAEIVTHNFTGNVTSFSGNPFGLNAGFGQQVQGSIVYDTSAGPIQSPPSGMSVLISGVTLQWGQKGAKGVGGKRGQV